MLPLEVAEWSLSQQLQLFQISEVPSSAGDKTNIAQKQQQQNSHLRSTFPLPFKIIFHSSVKTKEFSEYKYSYRFHKG